MKEEILEELRQEVLEVKSKIKQHNLKVNRINELLLDSKVKEFARLIDFDGRDVYNKRFSMESTIERLYPKYLMKIGSKETNKIYVYLGAFSKDSYKRISEKSKNIDHCKYWDIEGEFSIDIPINHCKAFEERNTVIKTQGYDSESEYYKIQREFFTEAVEKSQESAKRLLLSKYRRKR